MAEMSLLTKAIATSNAEQVRAEEFHVDAAGQSPLFAAAGLDVIKDADQVKVCVMAIIDWSREEVVDEAVFNYAVVCAFVKGIVIGRHMERLSDGT